MTRQLTHQLADNVNLTVTIEGWLHKKRLLGGLNFLTLRDRSGIAQIKIEDKDEVEKLRGLQIGTILSVEGLVVTDERAPNGVEVHNPVLTVLVPVTSESPIEIDKPLDHKSENLDTLFEHRVIGLRNLQETAIFKVQAGIKQSLRTFLLRMSLLNLTLLSFCRRQLRVERRSSRSIISAKKQLSLKVRSSISR